MTFPTPVNDQITDAAHQPNVTGLGDSPAMAMHSVYQSATRATSFAAPTAVPAPQSLAAVEIDKVE